MNTHILQLYVQWCQSVEANSLQYLKSHILARDTTLLNGAPIPSTTDGGQAQERFYTNFRSELKDIIKETKYLDRMGFLVPEAALNVALQVVIRSKCMTKDLVNSFSSIHQNRKTNTTHLWKT